MKTDKTAVTGIILETRKIKAGSETAETSKIKADKLHPVKLRVTYNKDRKTCFQQYYPMIYIDTNTQIFNPGNACLAQNYHVLL